MEKLYFSFSFNSISIFALNKVLYEGYDSAFTAKREQTFAWYKGEPINYNLMEVPRTQDIEPVFIETSAFFIFKKELWTQFGRRIGFRPYIQEVGLIEAVDIDMPVSHPRPARPPVE